MTASMDMNLCAFLAPPHVSPVSLTPNAQLVMDKLTCLSKIWCKELESVLRAVLKDTLLILRLVLVKDAAVPVFNVKKLLINA